HHYEQLIEIFNGCFAEEFNTRLIKGDDEPIYLPADAQVPYHRTTLRCLAPVKTLRRTDVSHYTFKDTINRIYKNATVQHQNSKQ
ncbi:elongation factor P hydroxylase, partial [Salmonella enterica subsp. enterica serovar Anatum]|nr:elongation factor P hydroxylase [Salmonella enterica subsp. enterica serovar Anatum]